MIASLARAERKLLLLEVEARGQNCVLELVIGLRKLGGYEPALARLAQSVEPFVLISVGSRFLVPQRPQLITAEEVGVARDDRGLFRHLFLADADGSPLLRP